MSVAHWRELQIYALGDASIPHAVATQVRAVGWSVSRAVWNPPHTGTPRGAFLRPARRGPGGAVAAGLHPAAQKAVMPPPRRNVDPGISGFKYGARTEMVAGRRQSECSR